MSEEEHKEETDREIEACREVIDPIVKRALDSLGEHCDTVRIFVTKHVSDDVGTLNMNRGTGNWFASYGQIKKWVRYEEAGFKHDEED